jgi:hypothetical protein
VNPRPHGCTDRQTDRQTDRRVGGQQLTCDVLVTADAAVRIITPTSSWSGMWDEPARPITQLPPPPPPPSELSAALPIPPNPWLSSPPIGTPCRQCLRHGDPTHARKGLTSRAPARVAALEDVAQRARRAGAAHHTAVRARVEIMTKFRNVGKFQCVLIMINPIISTRTRSTHTRARAHGAMSSKRATRAVRLHGSGWRALAHTSAAVTPLPLSLERWPADIAEISNIVGTRGVLSVTEAVRGVLRRF